MSKALVVSLLLLQATTTALAQDRGNLSIPYRFQLPFLEGGEYVVSAFGGTTVTTFTDRGLMAVLDPSGTMFVDVPYEHSYENNHPWFDMNGVVALSSKFLVSAQATVLLGRTEPGSFLGERNTHVASEFTVVYRPVERFEVFALYYQDTPKWTGSNTLRPEEHEVKTQDVRAGVTYFGKF